MYYFTIHKCFWPVLIASMLTVSILLVSYYEPLGVEGRMNMEDLIADQKVYQVT